ncbi:hypothetical protein WDZ17_12650 [Pseudokineococcus basanitobsidens]|uniref:YD repeat-containing protein n=1 Tax=Pseudokineococcus basanitobsidens TaxID=1926649 RepID=A0ABU8RMC0_9ACTN
MSHEEPATVLPAYYCDGTARTVHARELNADGVVEVDHEGRHWIPRGDGTAYWVHD